MKKLLCIVLAAVCFALTGCGGTVYEDTNGDDVFELETITDENIIALDTGASGLSYTEESLDGNLLSSEYSSKNFNGVEQIYLTNFLTPSDIHVYVGTLSVTGGNFKLAVVNNDEIIHVFDTDTFNEEFLFEDIEGSFSIHVAGESAEFEFYINIY